MKKITLPIIIALVAGLLIGYGLGNQAKAPKVEPNNGNGDGTKAETEPIKIGFIGPLTGEWSSMGTIQKAAIEVAAEEINWQGGVNGRQLEVIYEDGKCNATAAITVASKLINLDKVSTILGGLCSTETAAFAATAMEKKVIVISPSSSAPSLSKTGKYFFRSYPSDAFQGKFAAEYAYNTLGARKVAVLYHISEWGTGIKDVFEQNFKALGGEILGEEGAPQDARDYRTPLTKLKALDADYLYIPMYPDGGIVAVNQALELGITTKMLGGDSFGDLKFQKEASSKADILYVEIKSGSSDEFKSKILRKTGVDQMPVGTAQAYDNLKIIAQVMRQVGTDPDKIQDAMRNIQYKGVSGGISFDENGDIKTADYVVKRIQDGAAVEVSTLIRHSPYAVK